MTLTVWLARRLWYLACATMTRGNESLGLLLFINRTFLSR
jgi:hypothetical protein